jgi:hypothetical protein
MLDNGSQMYAAFEVCRPRAECVVERQLCAKNLLNCGPESNDVGYGCSHRPCRQTLAILLCKGGAAILGILSTMQVAQRRIDNLRGDLVSFWREPHQRGRLVGCRYRC